MKIKKMIALGLCTVMLLGITGMESAAASRQNISTVSLTIEANTEIGGSVQEQTVDITAKGDRFTVVEYEFLNAGFRWNEEDVPELKVSLYAEEDYYFTTPDSGITLKGATYVKQQKEDSSRMLIVYMKLTPLSELTQTIKSVNWSSETGVSWSESAGAGSYEVKLYRDGDRVGTSKITTATNYDFSSALTKVGNYAVRVRPINKMKSEKKGEWTESSVRYVDDAATQRNRAGAGAWVQDQVGWWYRNLDGTYTMNNWQQISNKWYFFDERGYMATGWINWNGKQYYCDTTTGAMLANTTTPDNSNVGIDGAKIS